MRTFLKILTFLWLVFFLYLGISMLLDSPRQMASDKNFIETDIKPSVDFVKNFKTKNGRFPNNREYYTWQREFHKDYSSDLKQEVDSLIPGVGRIRYIRRLSDVLEDSHDDFKNVNWDKDFAIGAWRGEWMEYYFSWTDRYDSNNYSWTDGFISLAVLAGIGIFPLLFWWFDNRKIRTAS